MKCAHDKKWKQTEREDEYNKIRKEYHKVSLFWTIFIYPNRPDACPDLSILHSPAIESQWFFENDGPLREEAKNE